MARDYIILRALVFNVSENKLYVMEGDTTRETFGCRKGSSMVQVFDTMSHAAAK